MKSVSIGDGAQNITALERVFKELVADRYSDKTLVAALAQIILDQVKRQFLPQVATKPLEIFLAKKALELIAIIDDAIIADHLPTKKLLWKTVVLGWKETEPYHHDREVFSDAILTMHTGIDGGGDAFIAILREHGPSRWLVSHLLKRANAESKPAVVDFMIRSVLRSILSCDERDTLLRVAKLLN
ncbi:MAG: hypothetical protein NTV60_01630 [Candidatus Kaiserbacteria bacterium]|nr:hypothetical protein [Candidatus Kaiserbacteria bacterium]